MSVGKDFKVKNFTSDLSNNNILYANVINTQSLKLAQNSSTSDITTGDRLTIVQSQSTLAPALRMISADTYNSFDVNVGTDKRLNLYSNDDLAAQFAITNVNILDSDVSVSGSAYIPGNVGIGVEPEFDSAIIANGGLKILRGGAHITGVVYVSSNFNSDTVTTVGDITTLSGTINAPYVASENVLTDNIGPNLSATLRIGLTTSDNIQLKGNVEIKNELIIPSSTQFVVDQQAHTIHSLLTRIKELEDRLAAAGL